MNNNSELNSDFIDIDLNPSKDLDPVTEINFSLIDETEDYFTKEEVNFFK